MSATGRSDNRRKDDLYRTPRWAIRSFRDYVGTEHFPLEGNWLEPCAGDGRIIEEFPGPAWYANELRPSEAEHLQRLVGPERLTIGSFLDYKLPARADQFTVTCSNPPFSMAEVVVRHALKMSDYVIMLLRTGFLGSARRHKWFADNPPDLFHLAHRPSFCSNVSYKPVLGPDGAQLFNKKGEPRVRKIKTSTDSSEYAWFVWHYMIHRPYGRVFFLPPVPAKDRRERQDELVVAP